MRILSPVTGAAGMPGENLGQLSTCILCKVMATKSEPGAQPTVEIDGGYWEV